MSYLIDTDVIAEIRKGSRCNISVTAWYGSVSGDDLFLSTLTLGEIRTSVERVRFGDPKQAEELSRWSVDVALAFKGRVLGIDDAVAEEWGRMSAIRSIPTTAGLLAATAFTHGLTLVTGHEADVVGLGATVLNPFRGAARIARQGHAA